MRADRVLVKAATEEQKMRIRARAHAGAHKRAGKLIPKPCEICGAEKNVEMHHDDHSKPLEVRWICCHCHRALTHKAYVTQYRIG